MKKEMRSISSIIDSLVPDYCFLEYFTFSKTYKA